jgi:hypothetical protein
VQVTRVGHDADPRPGRQRAQTLQGSGHLHYVIRREGNPPPCSSTTPSSQQTTAAHPPGPGLRRQAPSVHISTSPGSVSGRWPGSDLDRRRGLTAISRDSTNRGTRKAAWRAVLGRIRGSATPDHVLRARHWLTRSWLTQSARGALHICKPELLHTPHRPRSRRTKTRPPHVRLVAARSLRPLPTSAFRRVWPAGGLTTRPSRLTARMPSARSTTDFSLAQTRAPDSGSAACLLGPRFNIAQIARCELLRHVEDR